MWDSTFGRDVGWTPELALSSYMSDPDIPQDLTTSTPYPWNPETILEGLPELMDKADDISEILGVAR